MRVAPVTIHHEGTKGTKDTKPTTPHGEVVGASCTFVPFVPSW
jgi:hypothetical protein